MKINSDVFNLVDIHFHTSGEHLVGGVRPALEYISMEVLRTERLESAILFKVGDENDFIQDIIESIGRTETTKFNLASIYPQGTLDNYYYYIGSTSAPFQTA